MQLALHERKMRFCRKWFLKVSCAEEQQLLLYRRESVGVRGRRVHSPMLEGFAWVIYMIHQDVSDSSFACSRAILNLFCFNEYTMGAGGCVLCSKLCEDVGCVVY